MGTNFYNSAAENLLNNFLNVCYKYSVVSSKNFLINNLQEHCPFKVEYNEDANELVINLGEMKVSYKFIWEEKSGHNRNTLYRLSNIQIV